MPHVSESLHDFDLPADVDDIMTWEVTNDLDDIPGLVLPSDVDDIESVVLPGDVGGVESWVLPDAVDDEICVPPDDMEPADVNYRQRRCYRRFPYHPGPTRQELPAWCESLRLALQDPNVWPMEQSGSLNYNDHVAEIYSPRRVLIHTSALSLKGDLSVDKLTGWDLSTDLDRTRLALTLRHRRPQVLILSPPCTMFSCLQATNWFRTPRDKREARWYEAITHLQFSMFLCSWQHTNKRGYICEHPARALSWENTLVQNIVQQGGAICKFDMCAFTMVAQDDPTKFHCKTT